MADDAFYMKKALEEARRAYEEDEIPVGAVVVCGDRILARAHNLTETLTDVTAHAEMQALTAAAGDCGGCQCFRRKVFERMYALRNLGTVCDVCGGHRMGTGETPGLRGNG